MHPQTTSRLVSIFAQEFADRFAGPGDPPPVRSTTELLAHLGLQTAALIMFAIMVR